MFIYLFICHVILHASMYLSAVAAPPRMCVRVRVLFAFLCVGACIDNCVCLRNKTNSNFCKFNAKQFQTKLTFNLFASMCDERLEARVFCTSDIAFVPWPVRGIFGQRNIMVSVRLYISHASQVALVQSREYARHLPIRNKRNDMLS